MKEIINILNATRKAINNSIIIKSVTSFLFNEIINFYSQR